MTTFTELALTALDDPEYTAATPDTYRVAAIQAVGRAVADWCQRTAAPFSAVPFDAWMEAIKSLTRVFEDKLAV